MGVDNKPAPQKHGHSIQGITEWLVAPSKAVLDTENRQQARLLSGMLFLLSILFILGMIASSIRRNREGQGIAIVYITTTLAILFTYLLSRTRHYYTAGILAIVTMSIFPFCEIIVHRLYGDTLPTLVWLILPLLFASFLIRLREQVFLAIADVIGLAAIGIINPNTKPPMLVLVAGLIFTTTGLLIVIELYRRRLEKNRQSELVKNNQELKMIRASLEDQVVQRTRRAEEARIEAEAANQALELQVWQITGLAELAKVIRNVQSITSLSKNLIRQVCRYANVSVGALFITEGDVLRLVASYAYPFPTIPNPRFTFGSGLVGQAARDQQIITLREIPENYLPISSGLGAITPAQIIAVPCIYHEQVIGVMELASLEPFSADQIQYITASVEIISSALHTAHNQSRIDALLVETQQQEEALQIRKEEQQKHNLELERRETILQQKQLQLMEPQNRLDSFSADEEHNGIMRDQKVVEDDD